MPKAVEPAFESKSDYRIAAEIAEKLGIGDKFTEGRDERDWIEWIIENVYRTKWFPDIPTIDEFEEQNMNVYSEPITEPKIASGREVRRSHIEVSCFGGVDALHHEGVGQKSPPPSGPGSDPVLVTPMPSAVAFPRCTASPPDPPRGARRRE